jgi:hypothetical protein
MGSESKNEDPSISRAKGRTALAGRGRQPPCSANDSSSESAEKQRKWKKARTPLISVDARTHRNILEISTDRPTQSFRIALLSFRELRTELDDSSWDNEQLYSGESFGEEE